MSADRLAVFTVTVFVLACTPGLAVLLVVSHGMRNGWRAGVRGALGILTGNTIYFILSALGVGALIIASPRAFEVIRWCGVGYLVYMGARLLFTRGTAGPSETRTEPNAYTQAVLVQLANPKAIVYFTALVPQFIDPKLPMPRQFFWLCVISNVTEFPVLAAYAIAAHRGGHFLEGRTLARVAGLCLIAAAVKLAI